MNQRLNVWTVTIFLLVASGDPFAQTSVESQVKNLEETIHALERRVAFLEEQLQERNGSPNANAVNANWRKLRKGMSAAEVEKVLGAPSSISEHGSFAHWGYRSSSGYGFVVIQGNPRSLASWSEP